MWRAIIVVRRAAWQLTYTVAQKLVVRLDCAFAKHVLALRSMGPEFSAIPAGVQVENSVSGVECSRGNTNSGT